MKILKSPWKKDLLELVSQANKSIRITSPFVKQKICAELFANKKETVKFELITAFELPSLHYGSVDISAIEYILDNQGLVKNFPKLHSKIYLFDNKQGVITSGNLTNGGLVSNFEYGILIDEANTIREIANDLDILSQDEKIGEVKKSDVITVKKLLQKIPISQTIKFPSFELEKPEFINIEENTLAEITFTLSGWKRDVFKCINSIPHQEFTLLQVYSFEEFLRKEYPQNQFIKDKIRQQLPNLRDVGFIEFLGDGRYKKLWK